MTTQERLSILKTDLQLLTKANDQYLLFLLTSAESAIGREGIKNDGSPDYEAAVVSYAAYLFRKRASTTSDAGPFAHGGGETAMPRFLRYQLNNLLISQKAGAS